MKNCDGLILSIGELDSTSGVSWESVTGYLVDITDSVFVIIGKIVRSSIAYVPLSNNLLYISKLFRNLITNTVKNDKNTIQITQMTDPVLTEYQVYIRIRERYCVQVIFKNGKTVNMILLLLCTRCNDAYFELLLSNPPTRWATLPVSIFRDVIGPYHHNGQIISYYCIFIFLFYI